MNLCRGVQLEEAESTPQNTLDYGGIGSISQELFSEFPDITDTEREPKGCSNCRDINGDAWTRIAISQPLELILFFVITQVRSFYYFVLLSCIGKMLWFRSLKNIN